MRPKRPRLQCFGYTGFYRYFLTFCTHFRWKVFTNPRTVALVREQILSAARAKQFAILAYVFMPDHVHLLVEGKTDDADLKGFASLAKQKSAFAYSRSYRLRLWQPSYHDRVIRDEECTWDVIRYIIDNPLRAGLVRDITAYPFLGSSVFDRDSLIEELLSQPTTDWDPERRVPAAEKTARP